MLVWSHLHGFSGVFFHEPSLVRPPAAIKRGLSLDPLPRGPCAQHIHAAESSSFASLIPARTPAHGNRARKLPKLTNGHNGSAADSRPPKPELQTAKTENGHN